jgi:16S rRNA (cytidine1402-2'-O)-methyltransferase
MSAAALTGTLYVVATPIGNLADASPRSLEVLRAAELVACEDTRTTRTLLARYGIAARTVALHEHNERAVAAKLIEALRAGKSVALVSDAGTPALSDPGALLVAEAHRAGVRVSPVPGPSAAAAAFSAAGFAADGFLFAGFLPASGAARRRALEALDAPWPVILYEAPHRIAATLAELAARLGPAREVAIGRELTKKFEEVARLTLGEAPAWLAAAAGRGQGEFVIVVAPGEPRERPAADPERVLAVLLESLAPSEAARAAARITGASRRELYRKALERRK